MVSKRFVFAAAFALGAFAGVAMADNDPAPPLPAAAPQMTSAPAASGR